MRYMAVFLVLLILLTGCSPDSDSESAALSVRSKLLTSKECTFSTEVLADYGDSTCVFSTDVVVSRDSDLKFVITSPNTIAGITGTISKNAGEITFDNQVVLFQLLVDGQITPVCAPWLFYNTLNRGIIRSSGKTNEGEMVIYDDIFEGEDFEMYLTFDNVGEPSHCEFVWQGRRFLSMDIKMFQIL